MDDFILHPLRLLMNRENIVTRLENVEQQVGAVPSARINALGEMGLSTGSLYVDELFVVNHDAGLPDVTINQYGVFFRNQEGVLSFFDTNGGDNIAIYAAGDNYMQFANSFGGAGFSWFVDDLSHVVKEVQITGNGDFHVIDGRYLVGTAGDALGTVATNANDIFRCNSAATSLFTGTINGSPSGSTLVYTPVSGNENVLVPASTSQLAKMRLYNSSRGEYLLISNTNTGTNTITFTSAVPAGWVNGDTLTTASASVTGGGFSWVDLELTSGDYVGKTSVFLYMSMTDSGGAGQFFLAHPFEAFAASKLTATVITQTTNALNEAFPYKLTSNIITVAWTASGAATATPIIRQSMYVY